VKRMNLVFGFIFVLSTIMCFNISEFLWPYVPFMDNLQYPWRWQVISTLMVAILSGAAITHLWSHFCAGELRRPLALSWRTWVLTISFFGSMLLSVAYSSIMIYRNNDPLPSDVAAQLLGHEPLSKGSYMHVFQWEYVPKWLANFDYISNTTGELLRIEGDEGARFNIATWQSERRKFTIETPVASIVNVRTFWFPGWQATVNGQPVPLRRHPLDGTMLFSVPAGTSEVLLVFGDTPVRTVGTLVSLMGAVIWLSLCLQAILKREPSRDRHVLRNGRSSVQR
ncbi:MAG: hypothetical protein NZM00_13165, partial [Anaerolinea sp.]|nr:hypothetical protein [Anaerolinea sp.]